MKTKAKTKTPTRAPSPSLESIIQMARRYCAINAANSCLPLAVTQRWVRKAYRLDVLEQQARRGTLVMIPNPVLSGRGRGRQAMDSKTATSLDGRS